jgi:hypothetical protein
VIRRLFYLLLGAVLGIMGYRRATALARSLRPSPLPASLTGFAADVREGMALYMERHPGRAPSTLEAHERRGLTRGTSASPGRSRSHHDEPKDGR